MLIAPEVSLLPNPLSEQKNVFASTLAHACTHISIFVFICVCVIDTKSSY